MKYLVQILLFLNCSLLGVTQNLVTNPSFEDIDSCYGQPAGIGFDVFDWSGCKGWSCPIKSSSDLWCDNPIFGTMSPPENGGVGFQHPKTGSKYAGILLNGGSIISYREFVQNELLEVLEKDIIYKLSFYHSPVKVDCSINQFGVLASNSKMNDQSVWGLSHLLPSGLSDINLFLGDTSDWNLAEISFKAKGGEKYIIVGNFQDSTNATHAQPCDTSFWNGIHYAGNYFFLDDFSLEKLNSSFNIPNVFTPNEDGVNDNYTINVINIPDWELRIVNRWGNTMAILNESKPIWEAKNCSSGVYFYTFVSNDFNLFEQGYISVIR